MVDPKVVEKIVKITNKSLEDVQILIQEKKQKFAGLLTDEGAALMVARDLSVNIPMNEISTEKLSINELKSGTTNIDVEAKIKHIYQPKEYGSDQKKGVLCNLLLEDDTGEIRLTLWKNDIEILEKNSLWSGAKVLLKNCAVTTYNENIQLGLGYNGNIEVIENSKIPSTKISEINSISKDIIIEGKINRVYDAREYSTQKGSGKVQNFEIIDESGKIRGVAWDLSGNILSNLEGKTVRLEHAYVKDGLKGVELHLGWQSYIRKLPGLNLNLPETNKLVHINGLTEDTEAKLRGVIVDINTNKMHFLVCPKCGKKVEEGIEGFTCNSHGIVEPTKKFLCGFEIDDGTGVLHCVTFGNNVEKMFNDIRNNIDLENFPSYIEVESKNLIGKHIELTGKVRKNALRGSLECIVYEISFPSLTKMAEDLLDE